MPQPAGDACFGAAALAPAVVGGIVELVYVAVCAAHKDAAVVGAHNAGHGDVVAGGGVEWEGLQGDVVVVGAHAKEDNLLLVVVRGGWSICGDCTIWTHDG